MPANSVNPMKKNVRHSRAYSGDKSVVGPDQSRAANILFFAICSTATFVLWIELQSKENAKWQQYELNRPPVDGVEVTDLLGDAQACGNALFIAHRRRITGI